jgi:putative photosynthetic complex assembly protein
MTELSNDTKFPRWFLIGASALVLSSIVLTGLARTTGFGTSRVAQTEITKSVDIRFVEMPDRTMRVLRLNDGAELAVLAADGSGFLRGVVRSLFRQRLLAKLDRDAPFQLAQRVDGKLFIADRSLSSRIELDGFGPTNTQSITAVLNAGLSAKSATQPHHLSQGASLENTRGRIN